MAKKTYKYMNLNPFTVFVPGQRGVNVEFPSGYGSNDSWFSRFCGPKFLTNMNAQSRHASKTPVEPVQPKARNLAMLRQLDVQIDEETTHWKKASGIYVCKHCEIFRTGSLMAMQTHIKFSHKIDVTNGDAESPTSPEDVQPKDDTPPPDKSPSEDAAPDTPEEPTGIPCPHCTKSFVHKGALATHIKFKHPDATEGAVDDKD